MAHAHRRMSKVNVHRVPSFLLALFLPFALASPGLASVPPPARPPAAAGWMEDDLGRVHDDLTFRLYEKLAPGTWCLEVISRGGEAAGWKMLELPENAGEVQVDLEIRPGRRRCPR